MDVMLVKQYNHSTHPYGLMVFIRIHTTLIFLGGDGGSYCYTKSIWLDMLNFGG